MGPRGLGGPVGPRNPGSRGGHEGSGVPGLDPTVKNLQDCRFNIFGINRSYFRKMLIMKNNE